MDADFRKERNLVIGYYHDAKLARETYELALDALQKRCGHESVVSHKHTRICLLCGLEEREVDYDGTVVKYGKLASPKAVWPVETAEEFYRFRVLRGLRMAWVPE